MLPPVALSVFEQSPKFKNLYNDLKVGRLNDDGSTKLIKKQRAQDEIKKAGKVMDFHLCLQRTMDGGVCTRRLTCRQKLHGARVEQAKTAILQNALQEAGSRTSELPEDLRQVILIICAQLSGILSAEDREVVVEDFEYFVEHIEQVAKAQSECITHDSRHVADTLSASVDSKSLSSTSLTTLSSRAHVLRTSNLTQVNDIASKTLQVADLAASSALLHREVLQMAVRILEQSVHGTVSRATRAKAEHLATVARGMELKLAIISHSANPANSVSAASNDGFGQAIQRYAGQMRQLKGDTSEDLSKVEHKLYEYEAAGKGMTEIAKSYAALQSEMVEVKEEIARLKGAP